MRFLIHGKLAEAARKALVKHEHAAHEVSELPEDAPHEDAGALLPLLEKQQWNLLTTDTAMVRDVYEKKIQFGGVIVQILDEITAAKAQAEMNRWQSRFPTKKPCGAYEIFFRIF